MQKPRTVTGKEQEMSAQKAAEKRKPSTQTMVLLIIGIALTFSCLFGAAWHYYRYGMILSENHHRMELNGASGYNSNYDKLITAISTYNGSAQAAADEALNMAIFLTMGCAAGAFLTYYTLKQARKEQEVPETEQEENPLTFSQRPKRKPPVITH